MVKIKIYAQSAYWEVRVLLVSISEQKKKQSGRGNFDWIVENTSLTPQVALGMAWTWGWVIAGLQWPPSKGCPWKKVCELGKVTIPL